MRIYDSASPNGRDADGGGGEDPMAFLKDDSLSVDEKVERALKTVYDPEIPVNIHELGLIYKVNISDAGHVGVLMTLTTPNCPEAQSLPLMVQQAIEAIPEVEKANVEIVWDPPWTKDMMSEEAKFALGLI